MSERRALTLPMIGLLAMLAGWLAFQGFRKPIALETADTVERPRYHIEGAQWRRYDDAGSLVFEAQATGIDYFDDASMEMTGIVLLTHGEETGGSWQLTASRGSVPAGEKRIELKPEVRIDGQPHRQPSIEIGTPTLWVDWVGRTLEAPGPIVARSPGREVRAIGMRADWSGRRAEFLQQVESSYAAPG